MKDSSHVEIIEDPVKEDIMHLSMGYDGNPYKANCQKGISLANDIINRCAAMMSS